VFDPAEIRRMIARMSREIVLLFDHAGTPLPEFATVAHVAEWTGLEIKSLDRYRPRWSPGVAAKGRGQNRTLFHRDKLIAILREQFLFPRATAIVSTRSHCSSSSGVFVYVGVRGCDVR
jgi:hypothetical protein